MNYAKLYAVKAKRPEVYNCYTSIKNQMSKKKGELDEFDTLYIVYTAFICANPDSDMNFEEFMEQVPPDNALVGEMLLNLLSPSKKKEIFQKRFKKRQQKLIQNLSCPILNCGKSRTTMFIM